MENPGLSSVFLIASSIIFASPLNSLPNFPTSGTQISVSFSVPGTGTLNSLDEEFFEAKNQVRKIASFRLEEILK